MSKSRVTDALLLLASLELAVLLVLLEPQKYLSNWGGYGVVMGGVTGWLLDGYWVVMGWLRSCYGVVMGWLQVGVGGHKLVMGWLLRG